MKRYDKSFKEQAIRLVLEQGCSVPSVAKDIGVHDNTMYKWINQYKEHKDHAFPGSGNLRPEDEELRKLRKRITDLEMENEILKKVTAIFAKDRK
jgi:transposase